MAVDEVVKEQDGEVKRPDAQNAADIKGTKMNCSGLFLLTIQQFGNKVGTEQEEEADAERACEAEGVENEIREVKAVIDED